MNLFWKELFGALQTAQKMESEALQLQKDLQRYFEVAKSAELAEYMELEKQVTTAEFKENKRTLVNRKYKDTQEFRDWTKFQKLEHDRSLQMYFKTLESPLLKEYLDFQKSPDYVKLSSKKEILADPKLQQLKAFEKSAEYKNYIRYHNSYILDEYNALKQVVSTPEFQESNTFWANPKRWETTEEYKLDARYNQLQHTPDIEFYRAQNYDRMVEMSKYELTYEETFRGDWSERWRNEFSFGLQDKAEKALKTKYSLANQKQAFTFGRNVAMVEGALRLVTRKEKVVSPVWNPKHGFVEHEFEYSSDIIESKTFAQNQGLFAAKIRCTGKVHHALFLKGKDPSTLVTLFHFDGKKVVVGVANKFGNSMGEVKGLALSKYHVFSLRWTERDLIWYVNKQEIFRCQNNLSKEDLGLSMMSFISENQKGSEGTFDVEWIRAYKKK